MAPACLVCVCLGPPGNGWWCSDSPLVNTGFSLVAQMVKNPPATQETQVQPLDREDPLAKGTATHSSSCLENSDNTEL